MRVQLSLVALALTAGFALPAGAQGNPKVPAARLPADVLAGVDLVEDRFEEALAGDCDPERCYPTGCAYVAHTIVDRPASTSLPGLGITPGPSGADQQIYLTRIKCTFAHEASVRSRDAKALARRLKTKLSKGWTKVEVRAEKLKPVPDFLAEPPEPEPEPDAAVPEPDAGVPEPPVAVPSVPEPEPVRELWVSMLPHFPWMVGLLLFTFAALLLIWALRRLGRISPEEQALLAQMMAEDAEAEADEDAADDDEAPAAEADARISAQHQAWRDRLAKSDVEADTALKVLVTDLLRTRERRMLAKAVILFPEAFPRAFPKGGAFASAKFELAEYLKHVEPSTLPTDAEFFDKLDRYAMSAALTAQPDTELIRSLHDDYGVAALLDAVGRLPARHGALLFAQAPEAMQAEGVRRLDERTLATLADQLMQSNRMDPNETGDLLQVLHALGSDQALPQPPQRPVSDRGATFDATAALSIMLPHLGGEARQALVQRALQRNAGHLPAWMSDTLYGEMLLHLDEQMLRDVLLEVHVDALAAWLRGQREATAATLRERMPNALRAAVGGTPLAGPGARQALANDARAALSAALHPRLARREIPFHHLLT